jgi:transcriptional regulator with GAF, ATPase, and Fis domain
MGQSAKNRRYSQIREGLKKNRANSLRPGTVEMVPDSELNRLSETIQLLISTLRDLESLKDDQTHAQKILPDVEIPAEGVDFNESVRLYKISLIKKALRQSNGRQNKAARLLKLKTTTLNSIIKKYDILF